MKDNLTKVEWVTFLYHKFITRESFIYFGKSVRVNSVNGTVDVFGRIYISVHLSDCSVIEFKEINR
jgi:hypothetical protein